MRSGEPIYETYVDGARNLIPTKGFLNAERDLLGLTFDDGSRFSTTDHHPLWDASLASFTDAIALHVGDRVLSDNGRTLTIVAPRSYCGDVTAYNLQIDGIHTYYAGVASADDVLHDPAAPEGLTPSQIDDLAKNAAYDIFPGKAGAANPATRYYLSGTNGSVGFRVLPGGVARQTGIKGAAYLRFFGGRNAGLRIPLGSP
jgi:hypothetical protein